MSFVAHLSICALFQLAGVNPGVANVTVHLL